MSDKFERNISYVRGAGDALGFESVWSCDLESDWLNLNKAHSYAGLYLVYNDPCGDFETSELISGNTMLDLWKAAEKVILASGDLHHVYIEKFEYDAENNVVQLSTGS